MGRDLSSDLGRRLDCLSSIKSRTVLLSTSTNLRPVMFTPPSLNAVKSKSLMPCSHNKTNQLVLLYIGHTAIGQVSHTRARQHVEHFHFFLSDCINHDAKKSGGVA